ncbi:MAG: glycoside hydrolase family 1 protein [Erysipelotrichaceae bacterium]
MKEFLWGSATAAYQCEGAWNEQGKGLSIWDDFCHSEKNSVNPVTGDVSCDHFHRYEEDIKMLADGNQNAYRFSIAWTRIIPNGIGEVNESGVKFYNRIIDTCLKYNVKPLVTLYHYDMPLTLAKIGGWENRKTIDAFEKYAEVCFESFADRVDLWATINEPDYDTMCAYAVGNYPPNVKDMNRRSCALYNMLLASARAIIIFKNLKCKGMIGLVHAKYPIATLQDNEAYRLAKENADLFYNKCISDVAVKGSFPDKLIKKLKESNIDMSYALEEDKEIFKKGIVDYLGINAYSRALVKPYTKGETCLKINNTGKKSDQNTIVVKGWFEMDEDPNTEKNPWGMEIYPKCMYDQLMDTKDDYGDLPVIITENGVGYFDKLEDGQIHDQYRIDYCKGFIDWMLKAKNEGCNVQGYFVWSTMDLYSWINGYEKRYGLVYIDFKDNKRIPKDSYYWYKDFIKKYKGGNIYE